MAKPQRGWQRVTIPIPKHYGPTERQAIAQEVIDFIAERTRRGKDVDGDTFAGPYSKTYRESLDYKIAGKPKSGRPVNLTLSGDMIDSLMLLKHNPGAIVVGYNKGDKELNAKVEGNRLGTYGRSAPNPRIARDFLGISKEDLKRIVSKYGRGDEAITRAESQLSAAAAADELADGIEFEADE